MTRPRQMSGNMVSLFGPLTRMVKILLIANFAVFVLELIFLNWVTDTVVSRVILELTLRPGRVTNDFYLWQILSYAFLHSPRDPSHILLNMFMLWIFGSPLEQRWGPKRFLFFYLMCCGAGGLLTVMGSLSVVALNVSRSSFVWQLLSPATPHLGASGGIFGLTAGFALLYREAQIYMFFVLPMKAKWLIPLELVLELLMFLTKQPVSYTAHIGGLVCGMFLVTGYWRPSFWWNHIQLWRLERKKASRHGTRPSLHVVRDDDDPPRFLN